MCTSCGCAVESEEGSEEAQALGRRRGVFHGRVSFVTEAREVRTRCLKCGVVNPWAGACVHRRINKMSERSRQLPEERVQDVTLPRFAMPCPSETCPSHATAKSEAENLVVFFKTPTDARLRIEHTCCTCFHTWS